MLEENSTNKQPSTRAQNLNKLRYFIQRTDNQKPTLPSEIDMMQLIREYLNDDDFIIQTNDGTSIFSDQNQEIKLNDAYVKWRQRLEHNQRVNEKDVQNNNSDVEEEDIDEFLQYWIGKSHHLHIHYSLYDDSSKNNHEQMSFTINNHHIRQQKQQKDKKRSQNNHSNIRPINPDLLLQKFYIFYSKKQINSINNATFNTYQQYYNSVNINKWMIYLKQIGLTKFQKTINSNKFKEIFIRYQSKEKILVFQRFKDAVMDVLKVLFKDDEEKMRDVGFQIIGIKNKKNFEEKFKEMGYLPPLINLQNKVKKQRKKRKNFKSKTQISEKYNINLPSKTYQLKSPSILQTHLPSIIRKNNLNLSLLRKDTATSTSLSCKTQIYDIRQSKISQTSNSFLGLKIKKSPETIKKIKANALVIQQLMKQQNEDDDPYLKRYNNKENMFRYSCIANRIDERIVKIHNKY